MASSIRLYSNDILIGEIELGDTANRMSSAPGAYLDIFYADDNGVGLGPDDQIDLDVHNYSMAIENTKFPNEDFETISRTVVSKLKLGEKIVAALTTSGVEIKRRNIVTATYWIFIENDKFKEKLRLITDYLS